MNHDRREINRIQRIVRCLGVINGLYYLVAVRLVNPIFLALGIGYRLGCIRVRTVAQPLWFRYGSSDLTVFWQVFIKEEYSRVPTGSRILDLGANVGYASIYFLSRDEDTFVVAVEPDSSNVKLLERNLAPYQARSAVLRAAVWSHTTELRIQHSKESGGEEWATSVRPCIPDEEADITALDIPSIMALYKWDYTDTVKIDVEGAEQQIFSNVKSWVALVGAIAVELHGVKSRAIFASAISDATFDVTHTGSTTVATRRQLV